MEALPLFAEDLSPAVTVAGESFETTSSPWGSPRPRLGLRRGGSRPRSASATVTEDDLLLAVDGNSLTHRAFHAYHGAEQGAVYGFCALLAAVCDRVNPTGIVVGFDCSRGSVRRRRYPDYKAHRADKDPALVRLLEDLPELLSRLGVEVVVAAGWEADDVLGSAAATAESEGWRCVLATSDRDAFGLISEATAVLRLRSGMDNAVMVDRRGLRRSVGVDAQQYLEFAALRGDVSDNLPGIPGVGRRRAAALLRAFPTVGDAVADPLGCRSVLGPVLGQALIDDVNGPASVFQRNVDVMTINRSLPVDLRSGRRSVSADTIAERLAAEGLGRLGARMAAAVAARPDPPPPPTDADAPPWSGIDP